MTDTMEEIKKKLLDGSPPVELIKSGFARSTVYAVVQQLRRSVQDTSVAMDANYPLLSVVSRLREDNKNLQQANLQLAHQNGILQERVKTLENQNKLLTEAPVPSRRRLFKGA